MAFAIGLVIGCEDDDDANLPAIEANFVVQSNPENTGVVQFLNLSSNADTYSWDFGDGTTSTLANPVKTYGTTDTPTTAYTVKLTASNVSGQSATFEDEITIFIPLPIAFPIDFDDPDTDYNIEVFNGTSVAVVANPAPGGSNTSESNVLQIVNSGMQFEGIAFSPEGGIDLTTDKTLKIDLWSEIAIDVLLKLENSTTDFVEIILSHGGTGWEQLKFNFESDATFAKVVIFIDGPGETAGTFFLDGIVQCPTVDETPPVITLLGDNPLNIAVGSTFEDPGFTAEDTVDGDITANVVVGGDTVDTSAEGTFTITYNVSDAAGNAADEVTRTVNVSVEDVTPPVITLNGDAYIYLLVGEAFTDEGATAEDAIDGDISADISVAGDTVDVNTEGTYVITYNVSDAAGNAADEVTRTVEVFDGGLLGNGNFQSATGGGAGNWTTGVSANPVETATDPETGNIHYSVNVPVAGNPFDVNMSQVGLDLTQDVTYTLTFDAWSDGTRDIIAGIGLSGAPFTNQSQTVSINTTRTTYELDLTANFTDPNSRVIFDIGAAVGLVNIDNVSLVEMSTGGGGGSSCTTGSAPTGPASTLPVTFEDCVGFDSTFGGVTVTLEDNPSATGINTSATVLRVDKPTTADFFGGLQNSAGFNAGQFNGNPITVTFQVYSNLNDITFRCELAASPVPAPDLGNPPPQFATLGSNDANTWVELSVTFPPNPGAEMDYYNFLVIKPDDNQDDPNGSETDPPAADGIYYIDNITVQ